MQQRHLGVLSTTACMRSDTSCRFFRPLGKWARESTWAASRSAAARSALTAASDVSASSLPAAADLAAAWARSRCSVRPSTSCAATARPPQPGFWHTADGHRTAPLGVCCQGSAVAWSRCCQSIGPYFLLFALCPRLLIRLRCLSSGAVRHPAVGGGREAVGVPGRRTGPHLLQRGTALLHHLFSDVLVRTRAHCLHAGRLRRAQVLPIAANLTPTQRRPSLCPSESHRCGCPPPADFASTHVRLQHPARARTVWALRPPLLLVSRRMAACLGQACDKPPPPPSRAPHTPSSTDVDL